MNEKEIKEKIDLAKKIVSNVKEQYKIPAFQVILSKLLESGLPRKESGKTSEKESKKDDKKEESGNKKLELVNKCSITEEQFDDIIAIKGEDMVEILIQFEGKEKEKQVKSAECILLIIESVFDKEWVDASILIKCIEHSGVSISHISRTMNENNRIFRSTGTRKGTKYKLSGPGRTEAIETIQKLVEQNR